MTPTLNDANWDKLARYAAGDLPDADAAEVKAWLDRHPVDARAIEALRLALGAAPAAQPVDVEAALRNVKARIDPPRSWTRYVAFAAAAAVLLVAGTIALKLSRGTPSPELMTFATSVGERDSVVLADGSRILLGPDSRATIRGRDVDLRGEAFFVVTHDEKRPFTVRAGSATITDIGTAFSVHNDGELEVRVVVREGSVSLALGPDSVVLEQGDVGQLAESGEVTAHRGAATDDDLAWTRGRLVFRDAALSEISADLRRWYGVELVVSDTALLRRHFTGSFTTEPASRVVGDIAIALGARADQRGDSVYIVRAARR